MCISDTNDGICSTLAMKLNFLDRTLKYAFRLHNIILWNHIRVYAIYTWGTCKNYNETVLYTMEIGPCQGILILKNNQNGPISIVNVYYGNRPVLLILPLENALTRAYFHSI